MPVTKNITILWHMTPHILLSFTTTLEEHTCTLLWMVYSSTLKMEAICSSKTMANYTRLHRITAQRMVLFNIEEMSKKWSQEELWQNSKKYLAISTIGKKKFEITFETLEGFVGFKFSL